MSVSDRGTPGYLTALLLCIAFGAAITKASSTPEIRNTTINLAAFPKMRRRGSAKDPSPNQSSASAKAVSTDR